MKKLSIGLFALSVLIGGYFGSIFGIAIAIAGYLAIDGLTEELVKKKFKNNDSAKKEDKKSA